MRLRNQEFPCFAIGPENPSQFYRGICMTSFSFHRGSKRPKSVPNEIVRFERGNGGGDWRDRGAGRGSGGRTGPGRRKRGRSWTQFRTRRGTSQGDQSRRGKRPILFTLLAGQAIPG